MNFGRGPSYFIMIRIYNSLDKLLKSVEGLSKRGLGLSNMQVLCTYYVKDHMFIQCCMDRSCDFISHDLSSDESIKKQND